MVPASLIGVKPTVVQKMDHVANKLGLPGIAEMQGSTANLFDTKVIEDNANPQTIVFFDNDMKAKQFSNFKGELNAGEMNAMEYLTLYRLTLVSDDLTDKTNTITGIFPFVTIALPQFLHSIFELTIANDTVIKNFQLSETFAPFNPRQCGIAQQTLAANEIWGPTIVPFEAIPMLPPNNGVQVSIFIPPVTGLPANSAIVCVLGRTGSLFSARTTL